MVAWNRMLGCALLFLCLGSHDSVAQRGRPVVVPHVAPRPDDISSIDGIVKAFYDVVSGPAGQPRAWGRDRTLYIEGVRFVGTGARDGRPFINVMNHQQYVDGSDADFVGNGFFEREIHRVVHRFGNVAHVFSTYETRRALDGPVIARGLTSLELVNDGARWWIAAVLWDSERPGNPIPSEFLPKQP